MTVANAKLTDLENTCVRSLVALLDGEKGFSDVSTKDLARATGISTKSIRGVVGSLVKKGVFWVDDSCGIEVVYLQEQHWCFHPKWSAIATSTRPTTTIEIYVTPTGGFALTQSGTGKRWPTSALGPCDGFTTRGEAEQRKSDIETGRWQDTAKRIPVGFDLISE